MQTIEQVYRNLVDRFGQYEMNQIISFNTFAGLCRLHGIKVIEEEIINLVEI